MLPDRKVEIWFDTPSYAILSTPSGVDPIQLAFDKAVCDFKDNIKDYALYREILKTKSVEEVYDATDKLQEEQAAKGHLRHLSRIQPYLSGLEDYSKTIEVFVQVEPDVLALIWGPIKLLLQWAKVLKTSFDAIIELTDKTGLLLPEFHVAVRTFNKNDQIKEVLLLFYKDILDFYTVSLKFFRSSRRQYIFETLWPRQREKIQVVMNHIERHACLLRNDVRLEHIQQEHDFRVKALQEFERTGKSHQRQEYNGVKTDIAPPKYDDRFDEIYSRLYDGTGKWLLKDDTFLEWLDTSDVSTRPLWLQGIPGAGKTYLSGITVGKTRTLGKTGFAFLSYTSPVSALKILHSLIFQLSSNDDDLEAVVCESSGKNLGSDRAVAVELLSNLVVSGQAGTYLIIDGLDEIDLTEQQRLVKELVEICSKCKTLKVLISSRPELHLKTALSGEIETIRADIRVDKRNAGSVQRFVVDTWTRDWYRDFQISVLQQSTIQSLLAPLASNSKGMFLYSKVVLDNIKFLPISEIQEELQVLPESLDAAYARILSRINNLHPRPKELARKLLGWVACSPTPLYIREMEKAMMVVALSVPDMERLCGSLIEVVDGCIQFVHFTVLEYVTSPTIPGFIDMTEASTSLAVCYINYLCQSHHDPDLLDEEIQENLRVGLHALHEFARTSCLELVESCFSVQNKEPAPKLIYALEMLQQTRRADPSASTRGRGRQVFLKDEKGAKNISKWLGKSWDELVEETKRERGQSQSVVSHSELVTESEVV